MLAQKPCMLPAAKLSHCILWLAFSLVLCLNVCIGHCCCLSEALVQTAAAVNRVDRRLHTAQVSAVCAGQLQIHVFQRALFQADLDV